RVLRAPQRRQAASRLARARAQQRDPVAEVVEARDRLVHRLLAHPGQLEDETVRRAVRGDLAGVGEGQQREPQVGAPQPGGRMPRALELLGGEPAALALAADAEDAEQRFPASAGPDVHEITLRLFAATFKVISYV